MDYMKATLQERVNQRGTILAILLMHMVTYHTGDINLLKIHVEHVQRQTFVLDEKHKLQITNLNPYYTRSNYKCNLCTAYRYHIHECGLIPLRSNGTH